MICIYQKNENIVIIQTTTRIRKNIKVKVANNYVNATRND